MKNLHHTHISNPTSCQRPGVVSVQLPKKRLEENGSIGFGLRVDTGLVKINMISPDGLLAHTDIHAGDTLALIDGAHPPNVKTVEELQGFVTNAMFSPSGSPNVTVTVETSDGDARISEAVVFKEDASTPIGISFINNPASGLLQISKINPNGLLGSHSALRVGDYIERVNSCVVGEFDVKSTKDVLKSISGRTIIRVWRLPVGFNSAHTSTPTTVATTATNRNKQVPPEEQPRVEHRDSTRDAFILCVMCPLALLCPTIFKLCKLLGAFDKV